MSDQVIIALVAGLPAILLAIVALVKAFRSDTKAEEAKMTSGYAADDARRAIKLAYEAKKEM